MNQDNEFGLEENDMDIEMVGEGDMTNRTMDLDTDRSERGHLHLIPPTSFVPSPLRRPQMCDSRDFNRFGKKTKFKRMQAHSSIGGQTNFSSTSSIDMSLNFFSSWYKPLRGVMVSQASYSFFLPS